MKKLTIKIREMKEVDVLAVANIEDACFSSPYPEKEIRYELNENPVSHLYVATIDEEVVGYIDFMITFSSATITRICVTNEYRKNGIGQALLDKMIELCAKQEEKVEFITLEVRASNKSAINLYKKNKFEEITKKKQYYDDGEDAIYMVRSNAL
jgi:ribosomal-protein-alanine N-acetyltransferase